MRRLWGWPAGCRWLGAWGGELLGVSRGARSSDCVRDEPSSDTDLRLALVEPARQHTAHSPHTASVRRVARRRAACEKTHCSRLKSRACRLRPPSSHTHTHTHTTHMIGYASRPHQPLHEESASAKLFPAPWTRLFMCVHTPSRVGAEWRGAHVGMQPHAHRIRSLQARRTVLLPFCFCTSILYSPE